jgi:hypothetical protein
MAIRIGAKSIHDVKADVQNHWTHRSPNWGDVVLVHREVTG